MTLAELREATKEFGQPFFFEQGRPLNRTERAEERRLCRGRPKIGKGAKRISISLESGLLKKTDALARKNRLNRSQLIAELVTAGLAHR